MLQMTKLTFTFVPSNDIKYKPLEHYIETTERTCKSATLPFPQPLIPISPRLTTLHNLSTTT